MIAWGEDRCGAWEASQFTTPRVTPSPHRRADVAGGCAVQRTGNGMMVFLETRSHEKMLNQTQVKLEDPVGKSESAFVGPGARVPVGALTDGVLPGGPAGHASCGLASPLGPALRGVPAALRGPAPRRPGQTAGTGGVRSPLSRLGGVPRRDVGACFSLPCIHPAFSFF